VAVWTTPKTWNIGDILTAADMAVYVRDNTTYLYDSLNAEVTNRANAVTSEASTRSAADATHDSRLNALEAVKVIRGGVTSAGAVARGSGFSASLGGSSTYTVTFTVAFAAVPAVVAIAEGTAFHLAISSISASSVVITSKDNSGVSQNSAFGFIAYAI
jgi:hypothetical protein